MPRVSHGLERSDMKVQTRTEKKKKKKTRDAKRTPVLEEKIENESRNKKGSQKN
jgi:hypothetical protein